MTDSSAVVHLADDGPQSAAACREVLEHSRGDRDRRVQPIQERQELDVLAASKVLRP